MAAGASGVFIMTFPSAIIPAEGCNNRRRAQQRARTFLLAENNFSILWEGRAFQLAVTSTCQPEPLFSRLFFFMQSAMDGVKDAVKDAVIVASANSPPGHPECDGVQTREEKVVEDPKLSGKKARRIKRLRNEPPVFIGKEKAMRFDQF